jgi:Asp-tRNA(Asn)/Glu-tRNA(Gln) amidotransferase A subunit family amidase
MTDPAERLRLAPLACVLHALARGEIDSVELTRACLAAISRDQALNAWTHVDADGALAAAAASDERRGAGRPYGRLDGVPLAIKDNFDVAGMPTTNGLAARRGRIASGDAHVVGRLRGAGAVLLGKTGLDEAAFGTLGLNPHYGDVRHPLDAGLRAGGSSAGSAVAVAAGHAIAAIGSDTLGSVRIPAAFCGVVGLKPTFGELSCHGLAPALRRLDCPGVLARSVQDMTPLLQVMAGYDPRDPRSRKRRVAMAPPDWAPGTLHAGVVANLDALGADTRVLAAFESALAVVAPIFGSASPVALDVAPLEVAGTRRAALLLMEAEILAAHESDLAGASPRLQQLLAFAQSKSASDFARADRRLDRYVVQVRALFERFEVLLLPTTPRPPPRVEDDEPGNLADFTALASLAGCPALSLPLEGGIGLQLVGAPGSDLRLLELGEILAAVVDARG